MAYTFQKSGDNVQVSQDGKVISTTTPQNASTSFGYVDPTANAPKPVAEVGVVSSQQGVDTINQKTKQLSNLTPVPVTTPAIDTTKTTTTDTAAAPSPTKITLLNPTTGQSSIFEDASVNKENIQNLMKGGYQISETSGNLPSWLVSSQTGTTDTPQSKAQQEVDQASTDLKSLTDSLSKYTISDADLKAQTDAITTQWDARIADMQKVNSSRIGNINTTGIRLGSQYAGGAGGVFGGIVSEEERQSISRIGELEGNKQSAIAAAKTAAASQNWQVYSKQVDLAQKAYEDKITALKELNTATTAQNKLISDNIKDQQKTYYDQVTKPINDLALEAQKNGASPEVLSAISNATSVADAMLAAGDSIQTGTGIVGEYLFYKKQAQAAGQQPLDFNTYQTMDANRKAKATATANGGLPNSTLTKVTTVANQFDNNQTVKNYQTVVQALQAFKTAGNSPTDDISRIYIFAKTMDPNSSVREGEYSTVKDYAQAYLTGLGLKLDRIVNNDGFLTTDARNKMLATLENKVKPVQDAYDTIRGSYTNRINKITGQSDGGDYITDYNPGNSVGGQLIQKEADAENKVTSGLNSLKTTNPSLYKVASNMYLTTDPATGALYTATDILKAFPELSQ